MSEGTFFWCRTNNLSSGLLISGKVKHEEVIFEKAREESSEVPSPNRVGFITQHNTDNKINY
jgi:hypothetical protein